MNETTSTYLMVHLIPHVLKSFITTLQYIIIEPLSAMKWSYYPRTLAIYPSCCHPGPTLPLFNNPFGAFVLPPSMWFVGHLAGVWTIHNCGQNSFWCKRIIHGDFFISCIHILKHTRSMKIFPRVFGRDLLSKDLQQFTKCWCMCRECSIACDFFASLDNWPNESWGKARWQGLAL